MPELRDNLTIVYVIYLIASALASLVFAVTALVFWSRSSSFSETSKKIVGTSILIASLLFCYSLYALIEVRRFGEPVTVAIMQVVAYVHFIYLLAASATLAFCLSKFYELKDSATWAFVVTYVLAFANLAAATYMGPANGFPRWEFFTVSLGFLGVALAIQLLADLIPDFSTRSKNADINFARGGVRIWVALFSSLLWFIWFLGPSGIVAGSAGTIVFEQICYLVLDVLLFLISPCIILFVISPLAEPLRKSAAVKAVVKAAESATQLGSSKKADAESCPINRR